MTTLFRMTRTKVFFCILAISLVGGYALWHHWRYPYGDTHHTCISNLGISLRIYAEANGGVFPAGGLCPEASLSLLYFGPDNPGAGNLAGKTVQPEVAQHALDADGVLSPKSCAWYYVEGLTVKDDHRIAILWDKVGLGHFGLRLSNGGHEVLFVNGENKIIYGDEWPEFLSEQEKLLASRERQRK